MNKTRRARPHELAHGLSETARVTGIRVLGFEWRGEGVAMHGRTRMREGRTWRGVWGKEVEGGDWAEARLKLIALRVG
jgi:hypothetical protein